MPLQGTLATRSPIMPVFRGYHADARCSQLLCVLDDVRLYCLYVGVIYMAVLVLRDIHQGSVTGRTSLQAAQHHVYK